MKRIIICLFLYSVQMVLFAQTGPGGVGNSSTNLLWLKGNGIAGVANGAALSNWPDLSGNANDLSQSVANFQPLFQENIINGLPVVRFNSTNRRLVKNPFSTFPGNAITAIYVNKTTDLSEGILSYATGTGSQSNEFLIFNSNNLKFHRGASDVTTGVDVNDGQFSITDVRWRSNDGSLSIFKNGLSAYSGTLTASDIPSGGSFVIAGEQDAINGGYDAGQAHQGDFAEIILYNTYLNEAQNIILNNYLSAKYDIAITNNYYAYATGHPYDVAGIGRVDVDNIHNAAMSADILAVNAASDLGDGEYLFFGHDNGDILTWVSSEIPSSAELRLQREWRFDQTGNVGDITLEFDASNLPVLPSGYSSYKVMVDADGDFSSGAVLYDLINIGGTSTFSIEDLTLNDGDYVSLALVDEFIQFTATTSQGIESNDLILEIEMSTPPSVDVTVDFTIIDQTTTSGLDYAVPSSNTVTILAGTTSTSFTISIIDDALEEENESFDVLLSNPTGGPELGVNVSFEYTISDNDYPQKIYFDNASVSNDESVSNISLPVTLSQADPSEITTVDYAVLSGTASGIDDYILNTGTLTFAAGETATTLDFTIINDALEEENETIVIGLSNPTNANMSTTEPTELTYTILNDDYSTSIAFNSAAGSADENTTSVAIELVLSQTSGVEVSVDYTVEESSTAGKDDYLLSDGTLTISPGNSIGTIDLTVLRDVLIESDESVIITLSNPTNAALGTQTQFTYTIIDAPIGYTGPGGVGDAQTMVLWLRSEDLQLTDGDAVSTWPDASGNGNDLVQSDPGFRPIFKEGVVEGLPAVQFDGENDRLEKDNFSSFPTSQFTILNTFNKASDFEGGVYSYASTNSALELDLFWHEGSELSYSLYGTSYNISFFLGNSTVSTFSTFLLADNLYSKDGTFIYDGIGFRDVSTTSSLNQSITTGGRFALGAGQSDVLTYDADKGFFEGNYTESLLYNVYLNEAQRSIISNYLGAKYGYGSNDVINFFRGSGFTHEVAGIGQASETAQHLDAKGTDIVRINDPQGIQNNDYFYWGHNNGSLGFSDTDVPSGYNGRIDRSWSVFKRNFSSFSSNITSVDISFDLSGFPTLSANNIVLLIDDDGGFSSGATAIGGGVFDGNNVLQFSDISAFTDGSYFTLAINEPIVEFALASSSGSESINEVPIEITISDAPTTDVTVDYTVSPISATDNGTDYNLSSGSVIIPSGSTTAIITAAITDDTIDEGNETFSVTLSAATDAVLGVKSVFTYTIIDDPIGYSGPGGIGQQSTMPVWLRSEDLDLSDGSMVTSWPDASGNGNNLVQSTASFCPTFKESAVNGFPSVQFDGVNDQMIGENFTNFPSLSYTIINITQDDFDASEGDPMSYYSIGDNSEISLFIENTFGTTRNYLFYGVKGYLYNNVNSQDVFAMNEVRWNNTSDQSIGAFRYRTYADDVAQSEVLTIPTSPSLVIGAGQSAGGFNDFYDGSYAEFVAYSKPLNETQILISRAYFEAKYDLQEQVYSRIYQHNKESNGEYDFDVAGIGRLSDADYHIDAQGTGIVRVNNAQDLQDSEFFSWGHNGKSLNESTQDVPSGAAIRLARVWRVSETELVPSQNTTPIIYSNESTDVGSIDISFDLTGLGNVEVENLLLLIDDDGVFTDATSITNPVDVGGNVYKFSGVTAFTDNAYFTLATADEEDTPLPVELINFEGHVLKDQTVTLEWTTATEFDNSHFIVERSNNGEDFVTVSEVQGKGDSEESTEYAIIDASPYLGRNYYRLKQYDISGSFDYSPIVSLMIEDKHAESQFILAPNPVALGETLELIVKTATIDHYSIEIVDTMGRRLFKDVFVTQAGESTTRINTNALSKGVNFMLIKGSKGDVKRFKVLIR